MKNKLPTILLALSLTTLMSFDIGQEVELDSFLNARTHPNFLKYTKNIKTTLAKGTTGEVQEVKKFSSGNAGIKMKVTNGPKIGQSYWVYYNSKTPSIKLSDKKVKDISIPELRVKPLEASDIKLDGKLPELEPLAVLGDVKADVLETVSATREASEHATEESIKESQNLKSNVDETLKAQGETDCLTTTSEIKIESSNKDESSPLIFTSSAPVTNVSESEYKLTDVAAPFRTRPESVDEGTSNGPSAPGVRGEAYDTLRNGRVGKVKGFSITNKGPNNIVTEKSRYRLFEFKAEDLAASDMKVEIAEFDNNSTSSSVNTIMMFFPRSVLPSVKQIDNELHVTLPNKEMVKFNAETKEIIGGVFSEEKMTATSLRKPAHVKYTGAGVMIRADKAGDLPYGDIELRDGSNAPSTTIATISKKGHKDCKIPSKEIWYNDEKIKDVLIKPELSTDEGLDNFLKKKCNFSIF